MDTFSGVAQKLSLPGAVGVIPTDTVYGLAARASDEAAVKRLYELKGRDGKPGTLIAASIDQLEALGLKHRYLKAVEQFWPGAVSIIIPCGQELTYLHQGKYSLAVRIPDSPKLQKLLEQTGPLLTSSANKTSEPPATTTAQAKNIFGNQVDFYVDGGDLSQRQPSTVIRIVDDAIEVLRPGAVKINEAGRIEP
ncbi:MAG TPA: L-threonylcarbamoyladenylate synthase [Patescibacteria group bacterium]|nr:L-threonylcarbamoyladenylate synthase [Patescibacteria group bacterium]